MFLILTLASITFIWTRPEGVLGLTSKAAGPGAVLPLGCCLGMCTGLG